MIALNFIMVCYTKWLNSNFCLTNFYVSSVINSGSSVAEANIFIRQFETMENTKASLVLIIVLLFQFNFHVECNDDGCKHICTYIYAPVCGSNGTHYRSFGNECFMERENKCSNQSECRATRSAFTLVCFNFLSDFTKTEEENCAESEEYQD